MARLREHRFVLLTFILTVTLLVIAFGIGGLYPFGDRQIMIIDSWHQYYPIFQELWHKLTSSESLLYTWHSGGGTNFITMAGYYAMSPLYLFSVFFPEAYLREFFGYLTFVKIGLAGAFFAVYLGGVFKKNDLSITLFGMLYAFCGFAMGYYWNIMWLDAVALLPLIILGLHKLMDEEGYLLYVITLALGVASNFYIGYFLCEFIAIYFFLLYGMKYRQRGLKHFGIKLAKVVGFSLLGIGLVAVVLLPIFFGMTKAYGQQSANPTEIETYFALLDILTNMMVNIEPTIVDGLPNVRSGLPALIFMALYYHADEVKTRDKVINSGLVFLLLLIMNINYLDFAFHGFHFPNQVPHRFTFIFSFIVLTMAYEGFLHVDAVSKRYIGGVIGAYVGYLIVAEKLYTETFDYKVFYVSILFFLLYGGVMLAYKEKRLMYRGLVIALLVVIMAESSIAAYQTVSAKGGSSRASYFLQGEGVRQVLTATREKDRDFYRIEMVKKFGSNDPLTYRYPGLAQFASTANAHFSKFTRKIGMPSDAHSNAIGFTAATPTLHGMFGVKYLIAKKEDLATPNGAMEKAEEGKDVTLYKNIYNLPFAYRVDPAVTSLNLSLKDPFEKQQRFYQLATGRQASVYETMPVVDEAYDNMTLSHNTGIRYTYKTPSVGRDSTGTITFEMTRTAQAYVYVLDHIDEATVTVGDKVTTVKPKRGATLDLGILDAGQRVAVSVTHTKGASGYFDTTLVAFDGAVFERMSASLIEEGLTITDHSDRKISGTLTAKKDGYLYTSIPYEEGWTVRIDGERVVPEAYFEALLMVPITAGRHEVTFTYWPRGLTGGMLISLLSLAVLMTLIYSARKKKGGIGDEPSEK